MATRRQEETHLRVKDGRHVFDEAVCDEAPLVRHPVQMVAEDEEEDVAGNGTDAGERRRDGERDKKDVRRTAHASIEQNDADERVGDEREQDQRRRQVTADDDLVRCRHAQLHQVTSDPIVERRAVDGIAVVRRRPLRGNGTGGGGGVVPECDYFRHRRSAAFTDGDGGGGGGGHLVLFHNLSHATLRRCCCYVIRRLDGDIGRIRLASNFF